MYGKKDIYRQSFNKGKRGSRKLSTKEADTWNHNSEYKTEISYPYVSFLWDLYNASLIFAKSTDWSHCYQWFNTTIHYIGYTTNKNS